MRHRLTNLLLAVATIALPIGAMARDWQVDPAKSTLTFKGTYDNEPFSGRFAKFDATIAFDENDPAQDRFVVTVPVSSVRTESEERDDTLRTEDFFWPTKFPEAHFATHSFTKNADGTLDAKGTLTIRDKSQPVTLKVKFAASGGAATLDVDTTLNRLDFDLGAGDDWADIGKDVPVHGHLVLTAK